MRLDAEKDKGYAEDYLLMASMIYYWRKKKPDNDELKALSLSIASAHTYVQGLQNENSLMKKLLNNK